MNFGLAVFGWVMVAGVLYSHRQRFRHQQMVMDEMARRIACLEIEAAVNGAELDARKQDFDYLRAQVSQFKATTNHKLDDLARMVAVAGELARIAGREGAEFRRQLGVPSPLCDVPGMAGELAFVVGDEGCNGRN
jgi:hypothetical protein